MSINKKINCGDTVIFNNNTQGTVITLTASGASDLYLDGKARELILPISIPTSSDNALSGSTLSIVGTDAIVLSTNALTITGNTNAQQISTTTLRAGTITADSFTGITTTGLHTTALKMPISGVLPTSFRLGGAGSNIIAAGSTLSPSSSLDIAVYNEYYNVFATLGGSSSSLNTGFSNFDITTAKLSVSGAGGITTNILNASSRVNAPNVVATNITATNLNTTNLNLTNVNAENLTATNATLLNVSLNNIETTGITTGDLRVDFDIYSDALFSNYLEVNGNGNLLGDFAITNVDATRITTGTLQATNTNTTNITSTNLVSSVGTITNLNISNVIGGTIQNGTFGNTFIQNSCSITNLNVSGNPIPSATITNLNVSNITTSSLNIGNVGKVVSTFGQWALGGGVGNFCYYITGASISTTKTGLDFCSISNNSSTGIAITINYSGFYNMRFAFQTTANDRLFVLTKNLANTSGSFSASNSILIGTRYSVSWQEFMLQGSTFLTAGDVLRISYLGSSSTFTTGNFNHFTIEYLCGIPSGY